MHSFGMQNLFLGMENLRHAKFIFRHANFIFGFCFFCNLGMQKNFLGMQGFF
jgi:hypothetical protein